MISVPTVAKPMAQATLAPVSEAKNPRQNGAGTGVVVVEVEAMVKR